MKSFVCACVVVFYIGFLPSLGLEPAIIQRISGKTEWIDAVEVEMYVVEIMEDLREFVQTAFLDIKRAELEIYHILPQ